MKKIFLLVFIVPFIISSCFIIKKTATTPNATINSLKYLGQYEIPYGQIYNGTTVGGLSGIDYDKKTNQYYIICDDRSEMNPARFYTAKINFSEKGIDKVEFVNVTSLLQPDGKKYPDRNVDPAHAPDPEALRYDALRDDFIWTSEGERITGKKIILEEPAITIIDKKGKFIDTFHLPSQTHMYANDFGLRKNSVFEGLAFADNFKTMFISIEEPLYQDGPSAGLKDANAFTRIIKFNVATHKPVAQYAYKLAPIAHAPKLENDFKINGIPDIISIGKNKLLVIERSFSTGIQACTIRVYNTDLSNASDINSTTSLKETPFTPATKKMLLNMDDLGIYIDNIEGVTFGPDLPNGHKTLIFVSDNNFSKDQKTQFLLFEVD